MIEAANAAKDSAREKFIAAHQSADDRHMFLVEHAVRDFKVKCEISRQRYLEKLQELHRNAAQSQTERTKLNLAIRHLNAKFEGERLSLCEAR